MPCFQCSNETPTIPMPETPKRFVRLSDWFAPLTAVGGDDPTDLPRRIQLHELSRLRTPLIAVI